MLVGGTLQISLAMRRVCSTQRCAHSFWRLHRTRLTRPSTGELWRDIFSEVAYFVYTSAFFHLEWTSQRLKKQCENLELPIIAPPPLSTSSFPMAPDAQENAFKRALSNADIVLDCVFGASSRFTQEHPFRTRPNLNLTISPTHRFLLQAAFSSTVYDGSGCVQVHDQADPQCRYPERMGRRAGQHFRPLYAKLVLSPPHGLCIGLIKLSPSCSCTNLSYCPETRRQAIRRGGTNALAGRTVRPTVSSLRVCAVFC